jgi:pimeloyl-[acyl-carrier protein] methyl ester esterase
MDGTGALFEPFIEAMTDPAGIALHTLAYPAHEPLGYAALTEHAFATLPRTGPLLILGESFSGPIAVALAARCAARVRGVILCCSFVRNPRPRGAWLMPLVRWAPLPPLPASLAARALFGRHSTARLRALLAQAMAGVAPDVLRSRLIAVAGVDASAALAALRVPLLYLRAREDRIVPASALALVQQLRPDTRTVAFDAAHALLQVCPEDCAEAVKAFVREVCA